MDDDDEEGHEGRGHAGDGVAHGSAAAVSAILLRHGGAGRGEHGDEEGEPKMMWEERVVIQA